MQHGIPKSSQTLTEWPENMTVSDPVSKTSQVLWNCFHIYIMLVTVAWNMTVES